MYVRAFVFSEVTLERVMALEHPVVCEQIGHRPLFIGSSRAAVEGTTEETFSDVVTVSSYALPLTTECIPLVDGANVEYSQFKKAVEATREAYQRGGKVLVQCEVGMSRSAAIIATVLAAEEAKTFEEALEEVQRYRQRAAPRQPLRECAKQYLHEETNSSGPLLA